MTPPTSVLAALLAFSLTITSPSAASAQTTPSASVTVAAEGQLQELVLTDGTRAFGRVEKIANGRLTFRTDAGAVIEVEINRVVSASVTKGHVVDGSFWAPDPNPTRLFFAPTARSLKRGQWYFADHELVLPVLQVGITDHLSVGIGILPFFGPKDSNIVWFTPKLQVLNTARNQAAIGLMHIKEGRDNHGIAYAAVTHGDSDSAVTLGLGTPYDRGGKDIGTVVLMLGGEHRVSPRIKLLTENYFFDGGKHNMVMGGIRMLGDRMSADFGLLAVFGDNGGGIGPVANFVWRFGR